MHMDFENNKVCKLLNIEIPIIQAGMVWCSGWELASAVSNTGALGIIGSGSMYPDVLGKHLIKCKKATDKPFGVNVPLLYPQVEDHIDLIIKHKVPVVITSAGSPKKFTEKLKSHGIKVGHVVSSAKFAIKSQDAGVDFVIAEGFEAGGHNGREETTTLCLIPSVAESIHIPLVSAGGIYSGKSMLATMILGADAVQIGSRFVVSEECSASIEFKSRILEAQEGDTKLSLKKLAPVRLLKNSFAEEIQALETSGASPEVLRNLLGKGRAKKGMFEGELEQGELEIGQCSALIKKLQPAEEIVSEIIEEYHTIKATF